LCGTDSLAILCLFVTRSAGSAASSSAMLLERRGIDLVALQTVSGADVLNGIQALLSPRNFDDGSVRDIFKAAPRFRGNVILSKSLN
jgi:hypothetical protein